MRMEHWVAGNTLSIAFYPLWLICFKPEPPRFKTDTSLLHVTMQGVSERSVQTLGVSSTQKKIHKVHMNMGVQTLPFRVAARQNTLCCDHFSWYSQLWLFGVLILILLLMEQQGLSTSYLTFRHVPNVTISVSSATDTTPLDRHSSTAYTNIHRSTVWVGLKPDAIPAFAWSGRGTQQKSTRIA
jgi:hypothetical protein